MSEHPQRACTPSSETASPDVIMPAEPDAQKKTNAATADCGFREDFFATLARLEEGNFWFRSRNALILWAIRRFAPEPESFLEVGCGTGYVLSAIAKAYPEARLVGSEMLSGGFQFAAARTPHAAFVQHDARHLPFKDEFDVCAAFDVIEHIDEDTAVLGELYRATRPGGLLIVTVPQHRWLWSVVDEHALHRRRYSATELQEKVAAAGFEILRSTSFVSLLLPAMILSRLRTRTEESFDPMAEFRISRMLNYLLEKILDIERLVIRCGLDFPVGGSRLLVAKKPE